MAQTKQNGKSDVTDGVKIVSYVADNNGNHELVQGVMWSPVDVVNDQAWQEIDRHIAASKEKIAAGRVSCLHYYMTANQMDTALLASYTKQSRWVVRLHLIPFCFNRLGSTTLGKYAQIFNVSLDDLIQGELMPPVYNQGGHGESSVD